MQKESKELGSKSIVAFLGQVIGQLLAFGLAIFAGRLIGAEIYGRVIYAYTILTLFEVVSKLGFENSLVSFLPRSNWSIGQKKGFVLFALKCSSILSLLFILTIFLFRHRLVIFIGNSGITTSMLLLMSPMILFETVIMIVSSVLRAEMRIKEYYMATFVLKNGIRLLGFLGLYFIFHMSNVYALIIPYYLSDGFMILYFFFCFRKSTYLNTVTEKIDYKEFLRFSVPLLFSGIIAILNSEVDRYMLGYSIDSKSVGIYNMALNMGNFTSFTLVAVNSIFEPMVSSLFYTGQREKLHHLYSKTTKWILVINVMIVGMVIVFSEDFMRLAGEEYTIGSVSLMIIAFGQLINSGVGAVGCLNIMTGHPNWNMNINLLAVGSNVFLNFLLIPIYGMVGAAIASVVAVGLYNILSFVFMYRNLHMHPYSFQYCGIGLAIAIMLPLLLILRNILNINFFLRLLICGAIYVMGYGIIILCTVCDKEEKLLIKNFFMRVKKTN